MKHLQFRDGLDSSSFLRDVWQKRPLLMRAALPALRLSLSPDELAGLALEPDVEARLVSHDGAGHYQLRESPFDESEFTALPRKHWTLLVQDVDKHLPELASFLELFDFLPSWRFDDLMISAAAPGGGVGPHIDQYDVFLCQVTGNRSWAIGEPGEYAERGDSPLRQLQDFQPTEVMTLAPGDVLYLPPGVPHDGVAEHLCTTWSVGFRAPSQRDLFRELWPDREGSASEELRYTDADLQPGEAEDGLIAPPALERFRKLLGERIEMNDVALLMRLGRFLTRPKAWLEPEPPDTVITEQDLAKRIRAGEALSRHGMALFARGAASGRSFLFSSGDCLELDAQSQPLARLLCAHRSYPAHMLDVPLREAAALALLTRLYNGGQLLLDGDL